MKLLNYINENVSEILWMPLLIALVSLPVGVGMCLLGSFFQSSAVNSMKVFNLV